MWVGVGFFFLFNEPITCYTWDHVGVLNPEHTVYKIQITLQVHLCCADNYDRKMPGFWIISLTFSTMYAFQSGRCWVSAQSPTDLEVYLPYKELSVDICDSAYLRCCILHTRGGEIFWFKQENRKMPVFIAGPFDPAGETFHNDFQNPRFRIRKEETCFILTILNTTLSDEATYFCALMHSAGTQLQIQGSEMVGSLNWTVLSLGSALGLFALLISCLVYFLLRRRKCEKCKLKTLIENAAESRQESEAETMNYAALKFSKTNTKSGNRKSGSFDQSVYSSVYFSEKTVKNK
ncbi:uncharacterized protein LOC124385742 isoform X2 [Silurus meridionalis]|uniref:uncharacterized protein LOC124385742 isoform X2 n=1 Tax=Silurus meridionalis TaxID=175797 RepID=UPI001EEBA23E|nr:uncharacterized protein LOC124385742 isoform X2 [Silurus meridionalis]